MTFKLANQLTDFNYWADNLHQIPVGLCCFIDESSGGQKTGFQINNEKLELKLGGVYAAH